jgi:hypothetical protein
MRGCGMATSFSKKNSSCGLEERLLRQGFTIVGTVHVGGLEGETGTKWMMEITSEPEQHNVTHDDDGVKHGDHRTIASYHTNFLGGSSVVEGCEEKKTN